jgi:hypothetical protein
MGECGLTATKRRSSCYQRTSHSVPEPGDRELPRSFPLSTDRHGDRVYRLDFVRRVSENQGEDLVGAGWNFGGDL